MEEFPAHHPTWNRKVILTLWWILIVYEVAATIALIFNMNEQPVNWFTSFIRFQLVPTILQLLLMGIGYLAMYYLKIYREFIMIIWTMTMISIFILCIPEMTRSYELLSMPILLASIYFQKKYLIFAYSLSVTSLLILLLTMMARGQTTNPYEIIASLTILTATSMLCFAIMGRGLDLLAKLKNAVIREQDLLIRNVMTDRLSKVDALTELFNHRSFQEHTDHLISHMPPDTSLELALMDIDNFKLINDNYGHWVGDVVLKTIGTLLKELLGPDDMSFRYGGEEFAVLFVGKSHQDVLAICEKIMVSVRNTVIPEMPDQKLTMSIGVATYNRNTMKKAWFQLVDECLYTAKRNGKNCIYVHAADIQV